MGLQKILDKIDKDLSWRKKEISDLANFIYFISRPSSRSYSYKDIYYRSFILLIYAHLEGFIKRSGILYLQYIKSQKKSFLDLHKNFFNIFFDRQYKDKKNLFWEIMEKERGEAVIYEEISTKSNLNLKQMLFVIYQLGIEKKLLWDALKKNILPHFFTPGGYNLVLLKKILPTIDINLQQDIKSEELNKQIQIINMEDFYKNVVEDDLLEKRNSIAHGEKKQISEEDCDLFYHVILSFLDGFKYLITTAIENESFLRA